MSHPIQFRVYFPKDNKSFYNTGFENGKPVVLVSLEKGECFTPVYSKEIYSRFGEPIIQLSTGFKDKNGKMIFEGDVIYWHKFNWLGVVIKRENLLEKTKNQELGFWCQMKDGVGSLVGSNFVSEILFSTHITDYTKIQQFLLSTDDILKKYKISIEKT